MEASTYIAKFLKNKNIDLLFELQGGMITRIIDAVYLEGGIRIVSMRHEQAVSFAVDAFGRIRNRPGVALATSGPGATNLITGIGNCFFDSVPAIFITGQVNLHEQKGEKCTRQLGFQETDIVSIVKPITKAVYAIKSADEIPDILEEAYRTAMEGRMGPVLIDIPMNLQNAEIENCSICPNIKNDFTEDKKSVELNEYVKKYTKALTGAKRPLVLAGRGLRASGAINLFNDFLEKYQIPVVTSLLGFDVISYNDSARFGFIGVYGNRWANYALGTCDVLLILGSRLDVRQTGADLSSFVKNKTIFHVDIDDSELNNRIEDCTTLQSDLCPFLTSLLKVKFDSKPIFNEWKTQIFYKKEKLDDISELSNIKGINPNLLIHKIAQKSTQALAITTDVGNSQMWTAQSYELHDGQMFLSSGGMGAMGYALPAAIGACLSLNREPVLCLSGDGGFQINIQELETIIQNHLPIKIVIFNNNCLGMIRQFQDSYFESRYQSTIWGYGAPNFTKIAIAYGIEACSIKSDSEIDFGLVKLWEKPNSPFLLEVQIDSQTNIHPKMMFGNPITNMAPEVDL